MGKRIYAYSSYFIEDLVSILAKTLREQSYTSFESESIWIPNAGMESYLTLELARHNSICSGVELFFPARFLKRFLGLRWQAPFPFDPKYSAWFLWETLLRRPELIKKLPSYIQKRLAEAKDLDTYTFSYLLAKLYDNNLIYGSLDEARLNQKWQGLLWKAWQEEFPQFDLLAILKKRLEKPIPISRLFIFSINHLPPLIQNILKELSSHVELHFFFLAGKSKNQSKETLFHTYHKVQRNYFFKEIEEIQLSIPKTSQESILSFLQNSCQGVLQKTNPKKNTEDFSFSIHNCHSFLRELEVLRDWILRELERDSTLCLEDILVISPQIENYIPLLDCVFGENIEPNLPYNLLKRNSEEKLSYTNIFLKLLSFGTSRFTIEEILELLENEWIAKAAKISKEELSLLRECLLEGGIKWGIDEEYRASLGIPDYGVGTFQEGFENLFLSYAIPLDIEEKDTKFFSTIPMSQSRISLISNFVSYFELLSGYAKNLTEKRSLQAWTEFLLSMEKDLLGMTKLSEIFLSLSEIQKETNFKLEIDVHSLLLYLEDALGQISISKAFPNLGIVFADIEAMHGIPYKAICLLGMDEGVFPRREKNYEFGNDFIFSNKRTEEDRFLFWEIILSARKTLYLSYIGQSLHNPNQEKAPSVLLQELSDFLIFHTLEKNFFYKEQAHPYSSIYFQEKNRLSYSKMAYDVNRILARYEENKKEAFAFYEEEEDLTSPSKVIEVSNFLYFIQDSCQHFLRHHLDIRIKNSYQDKSYISEEDFYLYPIPFWVEDYLYAKLSEAKEEKRNTEEKLERYFPQNSYGDLKKKKFWNETKSFEKEIEQYLFQKSLEQKQLSFDFHLGDMHLVGKWEPYLNLENNCLIDLKYRKYKHAYYFQSWVSHLLWSFYKIENKGSSKNDTYFFCRDKYVFFNPLPEAFVYSSLEGLLKLYIEASQKRVCFFPQSSLIYLEKLKKSKKAGQAKEKEALSIVSQTWSGNGYSFGESQKASIALCFRNEEPFSDTSLRQQFIALTQKNFFELDKHAKTN